MFPYFLDSLQNKRINVAERKTRYTSASASEIKQNKTFEYLLPNEHQKI